VDVERERGKRGEVWGKQVQERLTQISADLIRNRADFFVKDSHR
jgi:hypothetical protein